ncbi:energy-coupled thiamine transporter ThiT [uncultured Streptococcus sp.]|uniref:energy-coupled thiamine transporter ThiT n=1 Tax=uncultured Streptococcus sp. TaxID=83427 RepID=UPI0027DDB7D4|nr:energy-coupled thiamine transporter ThiT [uncultured Streptococcus sp.]
MSRSSIKVITELAVFAAIAIVLDKIPLFTMPQGGSVSLVMLPILLVALRHGWRLGVLAGLIVGLVQLFFGGYFLNVFQVFLDYGLAYAGVGLGGAFAQAFTRKPKISYLLGASLLGGGCRLLGSFLAGVIFYADYAPKGIPVWLYSLTYNASYMIPSIVLCASLLVVIYKARPEFFRK